MHHLKKSRPSDLPPRYVFRLTKVRSDLPRIWITVRYPGKDCRAPTLRGDWSGRLSLTQSSRGEGHVQRSAWDRDTVPENFRSRGFASQIFQSPGLSRIFLSRGTRVPDDFWFWVPRPVPCPDFFKFQSRVLSRVPDFSHFVSRSQSRSRNSPKSRLSRKPRCVPFVPDF